MIWSNDMCQRGVDGGATDGSPKSGAEGGGGAGCGCGAAGANVDGSVVALKAATMAALAALAALLIRRVRRG
jgi:hypothetical protein